MHQSFVSTPPPPPTGMAVEQAGYGAVQVLFDCPHSAGKCGGSVV